MEYNFPVIRTTHPKPRPADETKLGVAKYFTDHMFVMDYDEGQGWHDGRVVPHEPFLIAPASCVLHYAQMMFEGMKAYRTPDGGVQIFRPDMNIKRMARTNERMCIPELPGDLFLAAEERSVLLRHQPTGQRYLTRILGQFKGQLHMRLLARLHRRQGRQTAVHHFAI